MSDGATCVNGVKVKTKESPCEGRDVREDWDCTDAESCESTGSVAEGQVVGILRGSNGIGECDQRVRKEPIHR